MNEFKMSLLTVSFGLLLAPVSLVAQNDPPPRCCPRSPTPLVVEESLGTPLIQSDFIVSPTMLQLRGITRSQFIDQVSDSLFAGAQVILGVTATRTISPANSKARSMIDGTSPNEVALVTIQETWHYWIPRHHFDSGQLDTLDQLSITDGRFYIKISFAERLLPEAERSVGQIQ